MIYKKVNVVPVLLSYSFILTIYPVCFCARVSYNESFTGEPKNV